MKVVQTNLRLDLEGTLVPVPVDTTARIYVARYHVSNAEAQPLIVQFQLVVPATEGGGSIVPWFSVIVMPMLDQFPELQAETPAGVGLRVAAFTLDGDQVSNVGIFVNAAVDFILD